MPPRFSFVPLSCNCIDLCEIILQKTRQQTSHDSYNKDFATTKFVQFVYLYDSSASHDSYNKDFATTKFVYL